MRIVSRIIFTPCGVRGQCPGLIHKKLRTKGARSTEHTWLPTADISGLNKHLETKENRFINLIPLFQGVQLACVFKVFSWPVETIFRDTLNAFFTEVI